MRLNKEMCAKILDKKPLFYFSGFGGFLIRDFTEHDGETYVLFTDDAYMANNERPHARMLYFDRSLTKAYFIWEGCRVYLDECIRMKREKPSIWRAYSISKS